MNTINIRSYADIAASLNLWREYVDPDMAFSDEQFNAMSIDERIAYQIGAFGTEPTETEISDDLGFDA